MNLAIGSCCLVLMYLLTGHRQPPVARPPHPSFTFLYVAAMAEPTYTVFVRVPIPRGGFVDPPPVRPILNSLLPELSPGLLT